MSTSAGWNQGAGGGWAAAGPSGGDSAYRTQTLRYTPVERTLSESVSLMTLFRLVARAFLFSFIVSTFFTVLWIVVVLFSLFSDEPDAHLGILSVGSLVSFVLFWVVMLASMVEDDLSEWKTLLEAKAPAAPSAYAAIYGSLRRRQIPVNAVAMRIRSDLVMPEVVNNRLVVSERNYVAYVSVFPYGTSLYVGWSMWRNRRGIQVFGTFFKDVIGSVIGKSGPVNQMLRTEKVRAMREAIHSAVREGVEVAVSGIEIPIAATFGQDIPVQDLGSGGASSNGPIPMAAGGSMGAGNMGAGNMGPGMGAGPTGMGGAQGGPAHGMPPQGDPGTHHWSPGNHSY